MALSGSCDSEVQEFGRANLPAPVYEALLGRGLLLSGVLDGFGAFDAEEQRELYEDLGGVDEAGFVQFVELLAVASSGACKRRRLLARAPADFASSWGPPVGLQLTRAGLTPGGPADEASVRPPPGTGVPRRWPTRFACRVAAGGGPAALGDAEQKERERWVRRGVSVVLDARLPVADIARGALDPEGLVAKAFGGKRSRTLRLRVRGAERYARWATAAGVPRFPSGANGVRELVTYLSDAAECASASGPPGVVAALRFFEACGGVPDERSVAGAPLVTGALREAVAGATAGRERLLDKANHYPVYIVASMERMVVGWGVEFPKYKRLLAWFRLVRIWSATRFDDLLHVRPDGVRLEETCLTLDLPRTKVSGPGKRILLQQAFVSMHAWVLEPTWLRAGLDLLRELAGHIRRDYLLPLPDASYNGVRDAPAVYEDSLRFGRLLLRDLQDEEGAAILAPEAALFWSEHGLRAQLTTWGSGFGVERHVLDHLGRWGEARSGGYVRARRELALDGQECIASQVRDAYRMGVTLKGELELRDRFVQFLVGVGWTDARARVQAERVFISGFPQGADVGSDGSGVFANPVAEMLVPPVPVPSSPTSPPCAPRGDTEESQDARFSVAVTSRTSRRTLHRLPGCGRVPGVHYSVFELHVFAPAPSDYTQVCRACWPEGEGPNQEVSEDESSSSSASSSSDSG